MSMLLNKVLKPGYKVAHEREHSSLTPSIELANAFQASEHASRLSVVWMYARGNCIDNDRAGKLVADCAAVGANVGADYLKIKSPQADQKQSSIEWLERAVRIAGNTKLLISGGPKSNEQQLLENMQSWIQAGASGVAIGKNIFQRPQDQAKDLYEKIQQLLMTP